MQTPLAKHVLKRTFRRLTAMSHPYGTFSGRGGHSQRNVDGDRMEKPQSQYKQYGGGSGQRHPPHLKGKEIGLYYKNKKPKEKNHGETTTIIKLNRDVENRINSVLERSVDYSDKWYNNEMPEQSNSALEKKYTHIHDSHFKRKFLKIVSSDIQDNIARSMNLQSKLERNNSLDNIMLEELTTKQNSTEYKNMLKTRARLPAFQKKMEILQLVRENQVVVVSGETGCGKTTQIAQFILDEEIERGNGSITRIICTQPRRISAISVAERVAAERAERLGKSVGFQIRLEKVLPRDSGSITYCTTGILLQFMQGDPALREFSHIILDEIHERTTESDFVLALLKLIIPKRPDLKVLLMSATLNSKRFSEYYDDCAMIDIPGFTYPVEEFYLEDVIQFTRFQYPPPPSQVTNFRRHLKKYKEAQQQRDKFSDSIDPYIRRLTMEKKYPRHVIEQIQNPNSEELSLDLIEQLIGYICNTQDPGAILVFLPGMMDITNLHKIMQNCGRYPRNRFIIYPLYSRMPTIDQKLVFEEPPRGIRKIIIATSIAETSITIEDIVYVIDSGKIKYSKFDVNKNIETLQAEWVSLANAKQRRGRAGRVKPGVCYHLYSKFREMTLDQYPLPEMLRTRLESVILQIKILQLGRAKKFLTSVMDPPLAKAIDLSLDLLRTLNALDEDENLTPLGYHLAQLPLDPRTGKMIIWASLFSCVEPVFAIAASLTFKDAFYCPLGKELDAKAKKVELSNGEYSDHIALAEALRIFELSYKRGNAREFCDTYFLSFNMLKLLSEMKGQFAHYLYDMKFLGSSLPSDSSANRNSNNVALIKAIVCAGLHPNIAVLRSSGKHRTRAWTPEDGSVNIHPSSVNDKMTNCPSTYIVYYTKQRSSAIFLHDTTYVTIPMLLFAAPKLSLSKGKIPGTYNLNLVGNENCACEIRTAEIIRKLRDEFSNMLEYKISHPGMVSWNSHEGELLNTIIELVSQKDEDLNASHSEEARYRQSSRH